eukprot:49317-Eustigmatos_ZCMA.PRE.1
MAALLPPSPPKTNKKDLNHGSAKSPQATHGLANGQGHLDCCSRWCHPALPGTQGQSLALCHAHCRELGLPAVSPPSTEQVRER